MSKPINYNKFYYVMKKLFSFIAVLAVSVAGYAQSVENFEVGPYEVEYKGAGDYRFRLRKGVDLYEYFNLKKDTTIQVVETQPQSSPAAATPLKHGIQVGINMEGCLTNISRYSSVYGINGSWKHHVGKSIYLNGGLSLGFAFATVGIQQYEKYNMFELGIPLSVEFSNISRQKACFYAGIGLVPTVYSTISASYKPEKPGVEAQKYSGLYIAPQIDLGGYIPVGNHLVRIGIYWRYKINCSTKDYDIYQQLIGRTFLGVNAGFVF